MATLRLVALDVDGTLLDRRQQISPNTRETIARLLAREIHVVLATGRLFINLRDLISQFGLTSPQITSGGSIVVMPQSGEVLYRAVIPRHLAEATLELADELGVTLLIARDNDLFGRDTNEDTAYLARFGGPAPTLAPDLQRVLEPAPTQLVAICTRKSLLADFHDCAVRLGLTRELAMCRGLPCVLDILYGEASKGHALRLATGRSSCFRR